MRLKQFLVAVFGLIAVGVIGSGCMAPMAPVYVPVMAPPPVIVVEPSGPGCYPYPPRGWSTYDYEEHYHYEYR